jgi:cytochrome c-type biogenesis protein CcmF
VRRNRRRYGGYIVHAGVAVALIGVAASTSFQHQRYAYLRPGQSAPIDGYVVKYLKPTATATAQKLSFGAELGVYKGGHRVTTIVTSDGYYPSTDPSLGVLGRFFGGSQESRVGLDSGFTRDFWAVISVNLTPLQTMINNGDRLFGAEMSKLSSLPPSQQTAALNQVYALRDLAIRGLTNRFITHPWTATFLLEVSPLVMWLWLGAIICVIGGLIALVPAPAPRRRRARLRVPAPAPAAQPAVPPAAAMPARELV